MATFSDRINEIKKANRLFFKESDENSATAIARECEEEKLKIARLKSEIKALKSEVAVLKSGDAEYVGWLLEGDKELQSAFKTLPLEKAKKRITGRIGIRRSELDRHCYEIEQGKAELFQLVTENCLLDGYNARAKEMMQESEDFRKDFYDQLKEVETKTAAAKNQDGIFREIRDVLEEEVNAMKKETNQIGMKLEDILPDQAERDKVCESVADDAAKLMKICRKKEQKINEEMIEHDKTMQELQNHLNKLKEQSLSLAKPTAQTTQKASNSTSRNLDEEMQIKKFHRSLKTVKEQSPRQVDVQAFSNKINALSEEIEAGRLQMASDQQEFDNLDQLLKENKVKLKKDLEVNSQKIEIFEEEVDAMARFMISVRHGLRGAWDGISCVRLPGQVDEDEFAPIETNNTPLEDCMQIARAIELKAAQFLNVVGEPEPIDDRERNEILINHAKASS